jgi:hypothetical protein
VYCDQIACFPLKLCEAGVCNVHVNGFSDSVHRTGEGHDHGYMKSMDAQIQWRSEFVAEQERMQERAL